MGVVKEAMFALLEPSPSLPTEARAGARTWVLALLGLSLGLALGLVLFGWLPTWLGPYSFHGVVIQSPQPLSNFTLTGPGDQPVSLRDFRGRTVLLYFGYTYCPDVCPATLKTLAEARSLLRPADQAQVQVIMISVDPERDSPATLADYLAHFDPSFVGLTGPQAELLAATTPLGIYFEKRASSSATDYLIDHTASVALVDGSGYLRLLYPFNTPATDLAADLQYMVRHP